jgi:hydrogenase expression/formation protein HypD
MTESRVLSQPSHEATIVEHGIRSLLPPNVEVRSGPGCPVCVTSPDEIDAAVELSQRARTVVTTFGDMLRVPSSTCSLAEINAKGGNVRVVYSIHDAVSLAKEDPDREFVHFAIGFETTAPTTASELLHDCPSNFSVICSHRLIPPAMEHLLTMGEIKINGFICPGHVSTIIGSEAYQAMSEKYKVPQVIAGFEPIDVLIAIAMIITQVNNGEANVQNEYTRSVRASGNVKAKEAMAEAFDIRDADWRGIGTIKASAFRLKEKLSQYDALKKFGLEPKATYKVPSGCRCGDVLRGLIYPEQCPLFNKVCTPTRPVGPCAVSREGACYISMRTSKNRAETPLERST